MTDRSSATIETLHRTAMERTGLSDFGDSDYKEALAALLDATQSDYNMTPDGLRAQHNVFTNILIGRLYSENGWARRSEVLDARIERPLIIVGLPRTGTTALHRLLSCDPQFQGVELWLANRPMTRPRRETWENYAEYRESKLLIEQMRSRAPELDAIHRWDAEQVEECAHVMQQSFMGWMWAIESASYASWLTNQKWRPCYERYSNVLKLIGAQDLTQTWLLKCATHLMTLDSLLEVFPDALIVQTHRDPIHAIPSWYSLQCHLYSAHRHPKRMDLLGHRMCEFWRSALDRSDRVRKRAHSKIFDVEQPLISRDPMAAVNSLYEYFNLPRSAEVETRMRDWLSTREPGRGSHQYNLSAFGVSTQEIQEMFADYRSSHGYA